MKARGIPGLEAETMTETGEIRRDVSVPDDRRTIEQHLLDADMIVKPFEVTQVGIQRGALPAHNGRKARCDVQRSGHLLEEIR